MKDQLISVIIAERPYRLAVNSQAEEETFRKAAKLVDEKMKEYAGNYAFRDTQDLLAMVNLQFAVECLRLSDTAAQQEKLKQELEEVDQLLETKLLGKSQ